MKLFKEGCFKKNFLIMVDLNNRISSVGFGWKHTYQSSVKEVGPPHNVKRKTLYNVKWNFCITSNGKVKWTPPQKKIGGGVHSDLRNMGNCVLFQKVLVT